MRREIWHKSTVALSLPLATFLCRFNPSNPYCCLFLVILLKFRVHNVNSLWTAWRRLWMKRIQPNRSRNSEGVLLYGTTIWQPKKEKYQRPSAGACVTSLKMDPFFMAWEGFQENMDLKWHRRLPSEDLVYRGRFCDFDECHWEGKKLKECLRLQWGAINSGITWLWSQWEIVIGAVLTFSKGLCHQEGQDLAERDAKSPSHFWTPPKITRLVGAEKNRSHPYRMRNIATRSFEISQQGSFQDGLFKETEIQGIRCSRGRVKDRSAAEFLGELLSAVQFPLHSPYLHVFAPTLLVTLAFSSVRQPVPHPRFIVLSLGIHVLRLKLVSFANTSKK